jgi:hypothetical protein
MDDYNPGNGYAFTAFRAIKKRQTRKQNKKPAGPSPLRKVVYQRVNNNKKKQNNLTKKLNARWHNFFQSNRVSQKVKNFLLQNNTNEKEITINNFEKLFSNKSNRP